MSVLPTISMPKIDYGPFAFKENVSESSVARVNFPGWELWMRTLFPQFVTAKFAQRHEELWDWADSIKADDIPTPFIAIWPRGGAKSTTAEAAVVRLAYKKVRKYCWYISGTQQKADLHVASIAGMLESSRLSRVFPELSSKAFGKFGNTKGWRRNRLRTASGFTVDALGLDVGIRGGKIDETRPDLIVLDDVDELHDSLAAVSKKIETLTKTILPSGAWNVAILFVQNLIHQDSVASQLVDGRADFLTERILSGPFKAVDDLKVSKLRGRYKIESGTPTWDGQNLATCQAQIQNWGLSAFLAESQHEVDNVDGPWQHVEFMEIAQDDMPKNLEEIVVWVDPAVTSTDRSDSQGISCAGKTSADEIIFIDLWEGVISPEAALEKAIIMAYTYGATTVGVETDNGGDTWETVFDAALKKVLENYPHFVDLPIPQFASDKAGSAGHGSKIGRNSKMLASFDRGECFIHERCLKAARASLKRFPKKPLDLADSMYWSWFDLYEGPSAEFGDSGLEGHRG